jgi:hypothetical protein
MRVVKGGESGGGVAEGRVEKAVTGGGPQVVSYIPILKHKYQD